MIVFCKLNNYIEIQTNPLYVTYTEVFRLGCSICNKKMKNKYNEAK